MTNTVSTLNGLFKDQYATDLEQLLPETTSLARDIKFCPEDQREGDVFNQPVILSREHGYTLSAVGGSGGAFTLQSAVAANLKEAQVQGAEFVLRSVIAYGALAKSMNGGKRAFKRTVDVVTENMVSTAHWVREFQLLWGGGATGAGGNLGTINSQTVDAGTSQTFDLTTATWAPGIFAGAENMYVDVYDNDGSGGIPSTKRNTSGTVQISLVDVGAHTLKCTGTEAEMDNIAAADLVLVRGGFQNEMPGVSMILNNTGTLFNIAASSYSMWQASSYAVGSAALTFAHILRGLNKGIARGLQESTTVYVSIFSWSDMMNDLAALRRYTSDTGKIKLGGGEIEYEGANGSIKIKPHLMMKGGQAMALAPKQWERVGPTDLTFKLPGTEDNFAKESADAAGVELRCYWNQGVFCKKPAQQVLFTGIVNASS